MQQSKSRKEWLARLAQQYHESLTPEVASYLEARGLGPTVRAGALLGVVVNPDPAHVQFEGRLAIPFITPTGIVHMRFRCLAEIADPSHECKEHKDHGKYEGPAGESTHLYNVSALHESQDVVGICEGELDALVATASGIPTVGVPGINNWKHFYYRLFDDYEKVIVIGDGDKAGRQFASTLANNIAGAIQRPMPTGYDVSSYVVERGPDAFREWVGE